MTSSHLFPLEYLQRGLYRFSTIQTIAYYFRIFKYQFMRSPIWGLFCESSRRAKILVAMAIKVVTAWKVVRRPYLTTLGPKVYESNVSVKYSAKNSVSEEVSKIGEYRIEIGKVRCGLGFHCYTHTHSLSHSLTEKDSIVAYA